MFSKFKELIRRTFGFCFEAISKILIEFTAKKAASTPEQHADPIKIINISKIKPYTLGSIKID